MVLAHVGEQHAFRPEILYLYLFRAFLNLMSNRYVRRVGLLTTGRIAYPTSVVLLLHIVAT